MADVESRALALVSQVRQALAQANTLEDFKRVRDKAEAIRTLAQKAKLGLEMQNDAAEFKLRAERRAGELLAAVTRRGRKGSQTSQSGTFRLADLGISRNQSSRWQKEASVSEEEFGAFLRATQEAGKEVSAEGLLRLKARREPKGGRQTLHARREGRVFVVPENHLPEDDLPANRLPASNLSDANDRLSEIREHHALLASMLLPFLDQKQTTLAPSARRHSARLLREISSLLAVLDRR